MLSISGVPEAGMVSEGNRLTHFMARTVTEVATFGFRLHYEY